MIKWKGIVWSVHPLFVFIMGASFLTGYFIELATLFLIVLVHEIGHVVAARSFGWQLREVKLLPFGGVLEVDNHSGVSAKEDAIVAVAGPLQNAWMGLAAWGLGQLGWWESDWAGFIVKANLAIGLFNMLPIYPLDGGKLLQAGLSKLLNYYTTMVWSARISLTCSALMLLYAVVPALAGIRGIQLNLAVVGLFLWFTNWTYSRNIPFLFYRFLMHRERLAERKLAGETAALPIVAGGRQTLMQVAKQFWRDRYHYVYLKGRGGAVEKVVPEQQIIERLLTERNPNRPLLELFLP